MWAYHSAPWFSRGAYFYIENQWDPVKYDLICSETLPAVSLPSFVGVPENRHGLWVAAKPTGDLLRMSGVCWHTGRKLLQHHPDPCWSGRLCHPCPTRMYSRVVFLNPSLSGIGFPFPWVCIQTGSINFYLKYLAVCFFSGFVCSIKRNFKCTVQFDIWANSFSKYICKS